MRRKDRLVADSGELAGYLDSADACRLAFAVAGEPYIVTLNFGYEWEGDYPVLFFHCAKQGRKLDMMRLNPRVCFQIDTGHELMAEGPFCDWGMRFSSIVGYGLLGEVPDEEGRKKGLDLIVRHFGGDSRGQFSNGLFHATTVLCLQVTEMTGKRKM